MEEEVEEEKRGITVGEVFRVAFTQKWLILIIAVIITIAGTLGIYFGYNKTKTQYAATFTVNFTDSELYSVAAFTFVRVPEEGGKA